MLEKSRGSSPDVSQPVGTTRAGPELCLPTFEAAEMFLAGSVPPRSPKASFLLEAKEEECDTSLPRTPHFLPRQPICL